MWTVVYISQNGKDIERLKQALSKEEILYMVRSGDDYFEILVPSKEIGLAHNVIIDTEM